MIFGALIAAAVSRKRLLQFVEVPEAAGAAKAGAKTLPVDEQQQSVYDHHPMTGCALISKAGPTNSPLTLDQRHVGDLWLVDEVGVERLIADRVIWAKFSPAGDKTAYLSDTGELFIRSNAGDLLAQIANVSDPAWMEDGAALTLFAVPMADYPEMRQKVIYNLQSGSFLPPVGGCMGLVPDSCTGTMPVDTE